ncbi:GTP-binding protein TrmE N-terminus-domain-containing protein [Cladorrhinum sp. PSN259]|nr:GTP-binding protein TrmE N-terminus-domain-containing protein [Cladorrhinum sp. PSN259]
MFRYALKRTPLKRLLELHCAPVRSRSQKYLSVSYKSFHELGHRLPRINNSSVGNDTIYALSSGAAKAGIAVIRISGSGCLEVYKALCPAQPPPKPRYAGVRTLLEPVSTDKSANIIDSDSLVLYFPGPKTVTGEDVLELHVHGGSATVKAVLSAIAKCSSPGKIRYAEPGEFTKRSFLNGRLDLAQVESLGDTLAAETEYQRRAAVRGNSGVLGKTYESWREQLLLARGEIEALIDFSEDQHFDESPTELLSNVTRLVDDILHSIQLHKMGSQRSELLRNGIRIALLGPPNVGKSSLMNQIVGREASIVSSEAGTTRDIVEACLDIRGYLCSFADTAGIRTDKSERICDSGRLQSSTIGAIEREGIRRARQKAVDSDVVIVLASVEKTENGDHRISYDHETLELAARGHKCLVGINKTDTVDRGTLKLLIQDFKTSALARVQGLQDSEPLTLSCKAAATQAAGLTDPGGVHALTEKLVQSFSELTSLPGDMQHLLGVTERQNQLLSECKLHLEDFIHEARIRGADGEGEPDVVLAAEHLRLAANQLAAITGRGDSGDVEEVLGVIFENFFEVVLA